MNSTSEPVRVIVAHRDAVVREAIAELVSEVAGLETVARTATADETLEAAAEHQPQMVILGHALADSTPGIIRSLAAVAPNSLIAVHAQRCTPQIQDGLSAQGAECVETAHLSQTLEALADRP